MGQDARLFSIIIPTYNRPRQLAACLDSLVRLEYPRDSFEVIVVDDGSETPQEAVVAAFRGRLNVTAVSQRHAGPATARNTGATHATGQFLAFTDDDCAPASDWLRALAARFAQGADQAVGGRPMGAIPDNVCSVASDLLIAYLHDYYNAATTHARFFTSNNLGLPADRFREIGGFDATFPRAGGEDRELCDRWLYHGYRVTYAPEVLVYHSHGLTFRSFCRQHFNYGRGAFRFHQAHARRGSGRVTPEPPSFYLNLVRYPFSLGQGRRAAFLTALLVVSQIANVAGFLREAAGPRSDLAH
jgi:glycosyltransferase involved in cell wall biosynthesis